MAENPPNPSPSKATVFVRRTASTLLLWAIVGGAFASGKVTIYLGLLCGLALLSTLEYFRMLREAGVHCYPRLGLVVSSVYCAAVFYFFHNGGHIIPPDLDLAMIVLSVTAAFALQLRYPVRGSEALLSVAANLLGFVYIAFLFNFATRIALFDFPASYRSTLPGGWQEVPGAVLLLWLLAVTKFTDMGAYITGSAIGKHKMIPHISPGKTWEGFFGALVFAQLAACGLYAFAPLGILGGWHHVVILGFVIAILAVIGDLAESVVKRALGAKDSGQILPGIGGALDLIDSICFTAPALYFYLKWVLLPAA